MRDSDPAVAVVSLSHEVGSGSLFHGLDLTARAGEVHAVEGASGTGKSTLLRMIGGLQRPGTGTIRAFDQEVTALRGPALRRYLRHSVGFVFQDAALVEQWTVRKNIAAAAAAPPRTPISAPLGIEAAADRVDLPAALLHRRACALSGGERQRVSIARILVRRPPLVLMDEPTAALDAERTSLIVDLARELADDGATVVIASHDPEVIRRSDAQSTLLDP